jgi:hypothetical protein
VLLLSLPYVRSGWSRRPQLVPEFLHRASPPAQEFPPETGILGHHGDGRPSSARRLPGDETRVGMPRLGGMTISGCRRLGDRIGGDRESVNQRPEHRAGGEA